MIITITGDPGSGKSTVAKLLAEKLRAERVYAGGILREMARKKKMTLEQFMAYTQTHPEIHRLVDQKIKTKARALNQQGKTVIVEGRVHFHFLPESVKIFMKVDLEQAAKRIWKDLQDQATSQARNENLVSSLQETKKKIIERQLTDQQRYRELYHINILDLSQFDLIIDTTKITPQQATKKIISALP